jgi:hypothetical protein
MDFLKKHYEKLLLGIVLLLLVVATAALPMIKSSEEQAIQETANKLIEHKVKPLTNLDLSIPENTLKRVATPAMIDLTTTNRLFNPMAWQRAADGRLIRYDHLGPKAVQIVKTTPLDLILTLDSVTVSDTGARYVIGVQREAAANPSQRTKKQTYCSIGTKNDTFVLRTVGGPPDNPTNAVLELNDTNEKAEISKEKPFRRTDGYKVDLKYPPESKTWSDRRVGSTISFAGEDYTIVDIKPSEVVLSAKSNQKKWTIKNATEATKDTK